MNYATLPDLRQYLGLDTAEIADDALLSRLLEQVSRNIEVHCGRRFDVRLETRLLDYPLREQDYRFGSYSAEEWVAVMSASTDLHAGRLRLDDDLLSATTVTNGNSTTVAASAYVLEPANRYPKHAIRLLSSGNVTWQYGSDGSREQVISVAGLWGYHLDYGSRAWIDTTDTVQDDPLTAAATTLTVNDADGLASDGRTRFQVGNLISIESEYLEITAVDTGANTLTVWRGVNGTTAASHANGTAISVYRPMADIERAALRWCKYIYRQKDADVSDTTHILGTGVRISPSAMPPDVLKLLPSPRRGVSGQEGLL